MAIVAFIGKPGSGKSTVAKLVASQLGWRYVSTGDIARQIAKESEISDILEFGAMAPEGEMRRRVAVEITSHPDIVLDGMPRNADQVRFLHHLTPWVTYISVDISDDEATRRLIQRGRRDDTEHGIASRLHEYRRHTTRVFPQIVRLSEPLRILDGTRPPDELAAEVASIIRG